MTELDARSMMDQDPSHPQLAAWAMGVQHAWEPHRGAWEEGELPWVEDMVEAVWVLLKRRVSVHELEEVESVLRASPVGETYLTAWYLATVSQYGQQADAE